MTLTYRTLNNKANELNIKVAFDNTEVGVIKFEITGPKERVEHMILWLDYARSAVIKHEYKENYIEG